MTPCTRRGLGSPQPHGLRTRRWAHSVADAHAATPRPVPGTHLLGGSVRARLPPALSGRRPGRGRADPRSRARRRMVVRAARRARHQRRRRRDPNLRIRDRGQHRRSGPADHRPDHGRGGPRRLAPVVRPRRAPEHHPARRHGRRDRPAEPGVVRQDPRCRPDDRRARRIRSRGHRHHPLPPDHRNVRSRDRRRAPGSDRAAASWLHRQRRARCAHRSGEVRPLAPGEHYRACERAGRARPGHGPVQAREHRGAARGACRSRPVPGPRRHSGRARPARGDRARRGQGEGPLDRGRDRPQRAGAAVAARDLRRAARRDRERRAPAPLPAGRRASEPRSPERRGARPVAAPGARAPRSGRVHPRRRAERAHRAVDPVGAH